MSLYIVLIQCISIDIIATHYYNLLHPKGVKSKVEKGSWLVDSPAYCDRGSFTEIVFPRWTAIETDVPILLK